MTDVVGAARGIQERHHEVDEENCCTSCGMLSPCADRLAADTITQAAEKATAHVREILDRTEKYRRDTGDPSRDDYYDAVAALALLTGQDHE